MHYLANEADRAVVCDTGKSKCGCLIFIIYELSCACTIALKIKNNPPTVWMKSTHGKRLQFEYDGAPKAEKADISLTIMGFASGTYSLKLYLFLPSFYTFSFVLVCFRLYNPNYTYMYFRLYNLKRSHLRPRADVPEMPDLGCLKVFGLYNLKCVFQFQIV